MARIKIDYGIDLGTTNSAIFRMEVGEPMPIKIEGTDLTMPSCVFFSKKRSIRVGDTAYNDMKSDKRRATKTFKKTDSNTFIEFKRTMGTDKKYFSSFMNENYTSEQLSAEVLKTLKSFVTDEDFKSVVITVPAKFTINQKDATARAAKLAGFEHCELLQEPIAASMAYGLSTKQKDGFWLVFDFGGGTFDAALLKVEDGIMKVIDTEGDNYLGGKNIDYAIVDETIIPYLKQNFAISNILANEEKRDVLREAMKTYAEEVKIALSFKESEDIISNLGDLGEDDEGTEIELDLKVTQTQLANAIGPIYQKAIDISKELLKRKNLKGNQLDSLILVGGPTFSPILRKMLKEQITEKVDTSVDPMTVVAKGAALYASTIEVSEKIIEENRDKTKIQLEIKAEPTTVETIEWVTIKFLKDKTTGSIPSRLYAEVVRADKAWSSGKIEINEKGDICEVHLNEGKANSFVVNVYDEKGSLLQSEPNEFTIIQGSKIGSATLPYHIGIEIRDRLTDKMIFEPIKGLEKNSVTPAIGIRNGVKTSSQIRPGMISDKITIPIYQADYNAIGSLAILNEHVYDLVITGDDLPKLLPAGSDIDLTIEVGKSEQMTCKAYFPILDETVEIKFKETVQTIPSPETLEKELKSSKKLIEKLKKSNTIQDKTDLTTAEEQINQQINLFEQAQNNDDQRQQIKQEIKRIMKPVDKLEMNTAWDRIENEIRSEYERLEKANKEKGDEVTTQLVKELYNKIDEVIRKKDENLAKHILDEINTVFQYVTRLEQLLGRIFYWDEHFNGIKWSDKQRARQLLNQGIPIVNEHLSGIKQRDETIEILEPIVIATQNLLPNEVCPKCGLEIGVPGGCPHVTN